MLSSMPEARGNGTVDVPARKFALPLRPPVIPSALSARVPALIAPDEEVTAAAVGGGDRGRGRFRRRENASVPLISDLLKEGQEILVQIAKEPIGKKGARITSHIALPGRFLVYMPTVNHTESVRAKFRPKKSASA